ncbi:acetyl-CoA carboxylase biotin carboxyl carrier protein [Haploplasma axanthum]|uniref:Biotin carboxyl carrier protein of acetyl-CoA carboxylase n=1 Tax=Haploplasma axanthum TaxID=29552 RepID=A0A449BEV1_HAPAX|nr:biotin/lipoyl-containing protein [Haploplasma axanthum]VEU80984.1 Biotin carboxyl carrier protein of acetyl-CoA carboxylase [Haploplasma axanthum]
MKNVLTIVKGLTKVKEVKLKEIQTIMKEFEESNLMTLELEMGEFKIKLSKNKIDESIFQTIKEVKNEIEPQINLPELVIKSPLVGTFYESATPESKPYLEVGSRVNKGDTVCIIEAMKIMNEIKSDITGTVEEVFFKNGDVVGYNDVLFKVVSDANTK